MSRFNDEDENQSNTRLFPTYNFIAIRLSEADVVLTELTE